MYAMRDKRKQYSKTVDIVYTYVQPEKKKKIKLKPPKLPEQFVNPSSDTCTECSQV